MKRQWTVFFLLVSFAVFSTLGCASSTPDRDSTGADAFDDVISDDSVGAADDLGADGFGDDFGDGSDSQANDDFASEFGGDGDDFASEFDEGGDDFTETGSDFDDFGEGEQQGGEGDLFASDFGEEPAADGEGDFEEFLDQGDPFGNEGELVTQNTDQFGDTGADQQEGFGAFEPPPADFAPAPPAPEAAPVVDSTADMAKITNIEFRSLEGGKVVISADRPMQYTTRQNDQLGQFVVEIENSVLPASLQRPFNTKDFDGTIGAIDAYQDPGSSTARIIVQMRGAEFPTIQSLGTQIEIMPPGLLAQSADTIQVDVPATADPGFQMAPEKALQGISLEEYLAGNTRFYGRPISIQTRDTDVRDVFNLIAEESGANLILSDEVAGNVTVRLRDVPWDQALVVIMQAKNLGYVRQGNVVRIAPLESLKQETDAAKTIQESRRKIESLQVRVIPVSYAGVEDIEKQVKEFLSDRGKVVGDRRTSSIVVTDIEESLASVEQLVKSLDIPPPQVLIEGKIVEAQESFSKDLGINWGLDGEALEFGSGVNGPISINPDLDILTSTPGSGMQFRVDIGTINILGDITSTFAMAEREELVKVISSPRVLTLHNEKAEINQTISVPILTTQIQDGTPIQTVTFRDVKLTLAVEPQITTSQSVIMGVDVTREFLGPAADAANGVRSINSRSAKTRVLVKDGQTAVIGGIYQNDTADAVSGVPGLRDLPFIGGLFRSRTERKEKNELLIFLTPRVAGEPRSSKTF